MSNCKVFSISLAVKTRINDRYPFALADVLLLVSGEKAAANPDKCVLRACAGSLLLSLVTCPLSLPLTG